MVKNYSAHYDLESLADGTFPEIDSNVCTEVFLKDNDYIEMWLASIGLKERFPVIVEVIEGYGAVSMSVEEHEALKRFFSLNAEMEIMKRKEIYYRGHRDNYEYLKQIAGLHVE